MGATRGRRHDRTRAPPQRLQAKVERGEPLGFGHTLAAQIGGQIDAGFVIAGFYEDRWYDDSWPLANLTPVSIATRAIRVA